MKQKGGIRMIQRWWRRGLDPFVVDVYMRQVARGASQLIDTCRPLANDREGETDGEEERGQKEEELRIQGTLGVCVGGFRNQATSADRATPAATAPLSIGQFTIHIIIVTSIVAPFSYL